MKPEELVIGQVYRTRNKQHCDRRISGISSIGSKKTYNRVIDYRFSDGSVLAHMEIGWRRITGIVIHWEWVGCKHKRCREKNESNYGYRPPYHAGPYWRSLGHHVTPERLPTPWKHKCWKQYNNRHSGSDLIEDFQKWAKYNVTREYDKPYIK